MPEIVKVKIGEREFSAQAVTLGTVRRVPQAFETATNALKRRSGEGTSDAKLPSPDEMNALVALVHDGIAQAAKKEGRPPITLEDFGALIDDLDMGEGMVALSRAVVLMFDKQSSSAVAEDAGTTSGNSGSSESKS